MEKIKEFIKSPLFFHSMNVGLILFAARIIMYLTHHWEIVFNPAYSPLSFVLIAFAWVSAIRVEKQKHETYTYGKTFWALIKMTLVVVFISSLSDPLLYSFIDPSLVEQTRAISMEKMEMMLTQQFKVSDEMRDLQMEEIKNLNINGFGFYFQSFMVRVLMNALLALIFAIFLRKKVDKNAWLNQ